MVRDPLPNVNWPSSISHDSLCPPWSLSIHRETPTRSPNTTSLLNTLQPTEDWEVNWPKISWVLGLSQACQYWLVKLAWLCILQRCLHYSTGWARTAQFLETFEAQLEPSQTTDAKDVRHTETAWMQTGDYLFSRNFYGEFHIEEDRGMTKSESSSLMVCLCLEKFHT